MTGPVQFLVFGIPIDAEYLELARLAWRDVKTWVQYGPKDLTPEDRARTEFVSLLADQLRREGVEHPLIEAWNRVGTPDAKEFAKKLQPGQPLGDLSSKAVLDQFKPLILSRLKHFGVAGDEDAKSAAQVGLLNALAEYDPAKRWLKWYEIRRWPFLDAITLTVHNSRHYRGWTVVCPDPDFPKFPHPVRIRLKDRIVIIVPEFVVRRFGRPKNIFNFAKSHLVQKHIYEVKGGIRMELIWPAIGSN
jgi:hypothetical protein